MYIQYTRANSLGGEIIARTGHRGPRKEGARKSAVKVFRLTETQRDRMVGFAEKLNIDDSALIRAAVSHVIDQVEAGAIDPVIFAQIAGDS